MLRTQKPFISNSYYSVLKMDKQINDTTIKVLFGFKDGLSAYLLNQAAPLLLSEFHQTLLQCHLLVLPNSALVLDLNCYCFLVLLEKHQLLNSGCYCHLLTEEFRTQKSNLTRSE